MLKSEKEIVFWRLLNHGWCWNGKGNRIKGVGSCKNKCFRHWEGCWGDERAWTASCSWKKREWSTWFDLLRTLVKVEPESDFERGICINAWSTCWCSYWSICRSCIPPRPSKGLYKRACCVKTSEFWGNSKFPIHTWVPYKSRSIVKRNKTSFLDNAVCLRWRWSWAPYVRYCPCICYRSWHWKSWGEWNDVCRRILIIDSNTDPCDRSERERISDVWNCKGKGCCCDWSSAKNVPDWQLSCTISVFYSEHTWKVEAWGWSACVGRSRSIIDSCSSVVIKRETNFKHDISRNGSWECTWYGQWAFLPCPDSWI